MLVKGNTDRIITELNLRVLIRFLEVLFREVILNSQAHGENGTIYTSKNEKIDRKIFLIRKE